MSVFLTNVSGRDLDVDDGQGGKLAIPAGQTVEYHSDIATDEVRQLLAGGQLKVEDDPQQGAVEDDDNDDDKDPA